MVDIPPKSLSAHDFKAESAALRFHHAVYGGQPTTSLDGATCKGQPKHGEIPVLEAGVPTKGCRYKAYPDNHTTGDAGYLDVPKLYQVGKEQGVHIKTDLPPHGMGKELVGDEALGSGVIVGKRKDELLVLTDNHVVPQTKGAATFVKFGDGKIYRARVVSRDPAHDGAILAVETGNYTDKEYKPAKIANDLSSFKHGAKALIVGYPEGSRTPYASPSDKSALGRANELRLAVPMPGEDTRRQLAVLKAQTCEGNSGGPTYNPKGELIGTLEGGPDRRSPDALSASSVNPITKNYVNGLIRKARP